MKLWITAILINWAYKICPNGEFKTLFTVFIYNNIMKL